MLPPALSVRARDAQKKDGRWNRLRVPHVPLHYGQYDTGGLIDDTCSLFLWVLLLVRRRRGNVPALR